MEEKIKNLLTSVVDDECFSKPICQSVIKQFRFLMTVLCDKILDDCVLFPSNDGGAYLIYKKDDKKLTIYMDGEHMSFCYKDKETEKGSYNNKCAGFDRTYIEYINNKIGV